jgi:hypothetical protein
MSTDPINRFMDAIEATDLDKRQQDFVTAILSLLAMQLSRLGPVERERALKAIEDDGALLRVAQKFRGGQRSPEVPCGSFH